MTVIRVWQIRFKPYKICALRYLCITKRGSCNFGTKVQRETAAHTNDI